MTCSVTKEVKCQPSHPEKPPEDVMMMMMMMMMMVSRLRPSVTWRLSESG